MIVQLTGTLVEFTASSVVLDVHGVGYELGVSAVTASSLPETGTPGVTLLTRMLVREDSMTLFGFSSREERSLFDRLCAISGVGPKLALSVLSTFTPSQLAGVVVAEDAGMMATVPGVGKKLASRLLLELESVFSKDPTLVSLASAASLPARGGVVAAAPAAGSGVDADVTAALLAMGFTGEEATLALEGHEEAGATSTKAAIQYALKRLGRRA
ncbi:Holliday junction branch migration protein RuvA [uncultured Parolsenella sp.]|uniref:Holliday junction branch migration protein RuvA n=1 Tax=uncultured Parolsenella sp. TaxID=2083008 RepID=UPI0025CED1B8|nr:Holliday junction branch migration protein RuvA [uncultured Parolsenella sp.]